MMASGFLKSVSIIDQSQLIHQVESIWLASHSSRLLRHTWQLNPLLCSFEMIGSIRPLFSATKIAIACLLLTSTGLTAAWIKPNDLTNTGSLFIIIQSLGIKQL